MLTIRGRLITPFILGSMSVGLNILIRHFLRIYEFGLWLRYHDRNYILKTDCLKLVKLLGPNLSAQRKMKHWYDENARERTFQPGDRVLALFPIPGKPLQARYYGPYTVD